VSFADGPLLRQEPLKIYGESAAKRFSDKYRSRQETLLFSVLSMTESMSLSWGAGVSCLIVQQVKIEYQPKIELQTNVTAVMQAGPLSGQDTFKLEHGWSYKAECSQVVCCVYD